MVCWYNVDVMDGLQRLRAPGAREDAKKHATRPLTLLQKVNAEGKPTKSAHPARFSPDDKFSRHRVTIKKR